MDERTRQQLSARLLNFNGDLGELRRLTADFDALWASDDSLTESDRRAVRDQWEQLEQIYAVVLDRGDNVLNADDREAATAAVNRLAEILRAV